MPTSSETQERLLAALAEQLKMPLLQIARQAELGDDSSMDSIRYIAEMGLQLVEGYLLGTTTNTQQSLELEPVSISSLLQNTAHRLDRLAKANDCSLEVHLSGKYGPVMAHPRSLEAAFTMLGYSMIEGGATDSQQQRMILGAHRSQRGLVTGIFADEATITTDAFRRARALFGTASQPLPKSSSATSTGIFVADSILSNMSAPLHVARHSRLAGLAATLIPSQQLKLV